MVLLAPIVRRARIHPLEPRVPAQGSAREGTGAAGGQGSTPPLLSQGITSICRADGVSSNVLRSMGVRTGRNPLRVASGCENGDDGLDQIVSEGAEVVPPGWSTRAVRHRTVDELRAELRASNDERRRYVSNFSRAPLFGGGGGHHSPIGGYLEDEDLAFVLDVNSGFGPWLVTTERLCDAMNTGGWSGGVTRGLARFELSRAVASFTSLARSASRTERRTEMSSFNPTRS